MKPRPPASERFVPFFQADDVLPNKGKRRGRMAVYALVCPIDGGVRYVGITSKHLDRRLAFHLSQPTNSAMREWFEYLASQGLRPQIKPLEYVSGAEWEDAERGWIYWFRQRGRLLNVDPGGEFRIDGQPRDVTFGEFKPPVTLPAEPAPMLKKGVFTRRDWHLHKAANKGRVASQSVSYGRFGGRV